MQTCQLVIKLLSDFLKPELFISHGGFDPAMIQQPPPTTVTAFAETPAGTKDSINPSQNQESDGCSSL